MIRSFCLAGCVLALNACAFITTPPATQPGVVDAAAWQARQNALADFDHWSLQGRAATGKILGWSGNLNWQQRGEAFDVRLAGPVGIGGMRAKGTLEQVEVRTEDGSFVTTEPEVLVKEALGWEFPLEGLRFWIVGLPQPDAPARLAVNDAGELVDLQQSGWRLAYTEYQQTQGMNLPRRIILDNGDNKIRLVVDRWFDIKAP